ncbi:MAG: hypothetical protein P8L46_10775 [Acidimicrobiales bacterium]|nr:hypothetical protein [Acidimicrobiales bacterium]MDG2218512.1 hypothetical protein [Acidimicrobiales bacterium]
MDDPTVGSGGADSELPISWDEAREIVVVVLLTAAVLRVLSPFLGYLDAGVGGALADDIAEVTRNADVFTGILLLGAGCLVATTPPVDVVPALRRAGVFIATAVAVMAGWALVVELTRASGSGMLGRLQSVFGRSGPGLLLAATSAWLARRVIPFGN